MDRTFKTLASLVRSWLKSGIELKLKERKGKKSLKVNNLKVSAIF